MTWIERAILRKQAIPPTRKIRIASEGVAYPNCITALFVELSQGGVFELEARE